MQSKRELAEMLAAPGWTSYDPGSGSIIDPWSAPARLERLH
jgi:hypothetical protein